MVFFEIFVGPDDKWLPPDNVQRQPGRASTDMEFGFLYNKSCHLQTVGYNVEDRKRDPSYYNLLASEARLSSFVAIALDIPPEGCARGRNKEYHL